MTSTATARITTHEPANPDQFVDEAESVPWSTVVGQLDATPESRSAWRYEAAMRSTALGDWAAALEKRSEAAADVVAREVGKPIAEAAAEVARAIRILRYYAQIALDPTGEELPPIAADIGRLWVERAPVGTVLAICPWNFPLAIPVWKAAPALAYGNRVILRPSSQAIGCTRVLAEAAAEALPTGALTVWHGPTWAVFDAIRDDRVAAVTFTGSETSGGQVVQSAIQSRKLVQAEMGGHNAAIVLDDADIHAAAESIAGASMAFAGQKCTATRRVIALRPIAPQLVDSLLDRIGQLPLGDPLDRTTVVGPMISADARSQAERMLSTVPATQVLAGNRRSTPGWFLHPTVVALDDPGHSLAQEELFGPVVTIMVADDIAEAVKVANATRFGLIAAVYGADVDRATHVARALSTGMARVNAPTTGVDHHAPFGGMGASAFGPKEQGRAIRDFVTASRTIAIGRKPRAVRQEMAWSRW